MSRAATDSPIASGTLLALLSALLFGASTPVVQHLGRGLGPFSTAALLYAGAAVVALATLAVRRGGREAPLRRRHLPRLLAVAASGAVLAPVALAWGLGRSSGVAASLLLNLEAVFTIALGAILHREHVGRRVMAAAAVMTAGGAVLLFAQPRAGAVELWGLAAVALATFGWSLDNALGRPLADLDPAAVVAAKGSLGATLSFGLALVAAEPAPTVRAALGLLAAGALGYGVSLRLYLAAQRRLGAGRTASVYALAPFAGALVASLAGEPVGGPAVAAGGALLVLGVVLHLTERHEHAHVHEPLEHEHAHAHDDGHHDHAHAPMPEGPHSHPHRHEAMTHSHAHAPDVHHGHGHD
jgi:drug/metabolite transporter (DMT)-like permease